MEDDEAAEIGQKKKKRKRNRKKKKNKEAADTICDMSKASPLPKQIPPTFQNNFLNDSSRPKFADPDFTPLKQKLNESFFEDRDSSEDEGMPDYKLGGYHPIHVGEILIDRYVII